MRTANSLRNVSISFLGQIFAMAIAFPARLIFVKTLGAEYLGVNGLFTNIVTLLSLADLGIGSAIIYSLYKPIAEDDHNTVKALMDFYKKAYIFIGTIVFIIGIIILPFLNLFISEETEVSKLNLAFLLFVFNASISYFYAYKRSIIIANQKNYIVNVIHYLSIIVLNVFQMIVLLVTNDFILFLLLQVIFTVSENIIISRRANNMFPYLVRKNKNKIKESQRKEIFSNVRAVLMHKIGSVTVLGTDNVIISMFLGVYWVGIYSNYYLITNALNSILNQVFNSLTASVGNLVVQENSEKQYQVFKNVFFINFWIIGFCSISLLLLINPFINIWLGKEFILTNDIVFIIVLNFYIFCMRNSALLFKNAAGLFRPDRYKPLVEALLNIVFSITLVKVMGIKGVLIGTVLSMMLTSLWVEPFVIYKYIFKKPLFLYFRSYFCYTIILFSVGLITHKFWLIFNEDGLIFFFLQVLVCILIPNMLFYIIFRETQGFEYFTSKILKFKKVRG